MYRTPFLFFTGIICLIKLPFIHFVPLWDGGVYMYCLKNAASIPFKLSNFSCAGHTSNAYMFILSLTQFMGWGSVEWVHITNTVLFIISAWVFYRIIEIIFPGSTSAERLMLTILLVVNPSLLANSLNLNLDFGLFVFFQIFLFSLLRRRYIESIFFGLLMIFSKETGIVIYIVFVFWFVLKRIFINCQDKKRMNIIFIIPFLILLGYIATTKTFWVTSVSTSGSIIKSILNSTNSWSNKTYISNIFLVFGLNFMWMVSGVIIIAFIKKKIKVIQKKDWLWDKSIFRGHGIQIVTFLSFITITILLIGYKTYANSRYFLVTLPGMMLLFYVALKYLIQSVKVRIIIMGVFCILFYIQCYFSIDPMGFAVYGGFDFGTHKMYKMTGFTRECCGYGRDQLIYNLEYTKIHDLSNYILADLKPQDTTVFSSVSGANYYVIGAYESNTFKRNNNLQQVKYISYRSGEEIVQDVEKPKSVYFIVFPNFPSDEVLNQLYVYYKKLGSVIYEIDGYTIEVIQMGLIK